MSFAMFSPTAGEPEVTPLPLGRYRKSEALLRKAQRLIPGGHHLSGRPLLTPETSPMYMERGEGCRVWDVDGHEYLDYIGAYGPCLLGYAHPVVDAAAIRQIRNGALLSLNHPLHVAFAERLTELLTGGEMAAFFKTGSEATTAALRVARRATGRRKVVRCGYHGWHDWCLPGEPFVPEMGEQVLSFDPRRSASLSEILQQHPHEVAAVIVAPEMILPTSQAVFAELLEATHRAGAVFILDEVKTGLRIRPGFFQQYVGIVPDLTTLSKALGNGWPVAALVGSRAIMEHGAGLHISATYHGETAGIAAALATLDIVQQEDVCGHVWRLGEMLIDGLNHLAVFHGIPAKAYGEPLPPMPFLRFSVRDPELTQALENTFYSELYVAGILFHPRHLWFISYAHRMGDIERTLEAADKALRVTAERHGAELARGLSP